MFDITHHTTTELLKIHTAVTRELRSREILRTNNVVGDYTEWLVTSRLGLQLCPNSTKGHDATDTNSLRYQIKGRRHTAKNRSCQLGVIRSLDDQPFHYLIAVIYEEDWTVTAAFKIPYTTVKALAKFNSHQNGYLLHARAGLLEHPGVTDIQKILA